MKKAAYVCDVCGAVRGEANHWLLFGGWNGAMTVIQWEDEASERYEHICGRECLNKRIEKWLSA